MRNRTAGSDIGKASRSNHCIMSHYIMMEQPDTVTVYIDNYIDGLPLSELVSLE